MKELRFATLMRASTNKQTAAGKKKKAARSGKISSRKVNEENQIPEQKTNIMRFVETQPEAHKGIKWVDSGLEFIEAGVSGFHTHTSKRKGLQDAYEAAKKGEYDILILYKLDRFGRRSVESLDMAIKFLKHCRIWVVDKGVEFKNTGEQDEILNFIEFWSAKKASQETKVRVTDAMKNIHNDGYWTGGNPPYGYENHPEIANMLKVIPSEAEVVKEIYDLYVNHGYGYLKISAHLNEKGIPSKTGKKWSSHTVRKILFNTVYMGHLSYGKTKTVEGEFGSYQKALKNGEGSVSAKYWKEYDLIGKELFEKAQKIKSSRVKPNMFGGNIPSSKATGKGLLVGVLKCECGGHMTYSTASDWADSKRTKKKEPYGIYRCQTRLKQGVAACGAKKATYRTAEHDEKIIAKLGEYTKQMLDEKEIEKIRSLTEAATENVKEKIAETKADIERYTTARENANAAIMKIMMGESKANQNQMQEIYEMAEEQLKKLNQQLEEYESLKSTDNLNEVDMMKLEDYVLNWQFIFNHGTQQQKRNLIAALADEIQITKDKITIKTSFDIIKFVEAITAIKETAHAEIAASLEAQAVEASASCLHTVDSRSSYSTHDTGMISATFLQSVNSSDSDSTQDTKYLLKKLSKAFGSNKVKNTMIFAS